MPDPGCWIAMPPVVDGTWLPGTVEPLPETGAGDAIEPVSVGLLGF